MSSWSGPCKGATLLIILLLYGVCLPVWGQRIEIEVDPAYQHEFYELDETQGLKGNLPHHFLMDREGYIWCIDNGLVQRYNGTSFEVFFKTSRRYDYTHKLLEDDQGKIWMYEYKGTNYPHPYFQEFYLTGIDPETKEIIPADNFLNWEALGCSLKDINAIESIERDRSILIGLKDGRLISNKQEGQVIWREPNGSPITLITSNQSGDIALASDQQVSILDSSRAVIKTQAFEKALAFLSLDEEHGFFGGFVKEKNKAFYVPFSGEPSSSYKFLLNEFNEVAATRINIVNDSFLTTRNTIWGRNKKQPLFNCSGCPGLFIDRQNNFWTANYAGITVSNLKPKRFQSLLSGYKVETRGILPLSDSTLLVHSYGGGFIVDLKDRVLDHNKVIDGGLGITMDPHGRIWQGVHGHDLNYIADYKDQFTLVKEMDTSIIAAPNFIVVPMATDAGVWLGKNEGLSFCALDKHSARTGCTVIRHPVLEKASINFLQDYGQVIWAATSKGLFEIDAVTFEVVQYYEQLGDLRINHFSREDSIIWFSTYEDGLIKWKYQAADYESIPLTESNFYDEPLALCAVYDDGLGYLWLPSLDGLFRLKKSDQSYQRFDEKDHIAHNEFNFFSHARMPDGKLLFGGLNGITVVDPHLIDLLDKTEPAISLEIDNAFIFDNRNSREIFIRNGESLSLIGQRENLRFDAHLLDFRSKKRGKIMYQLEGLDEEWQVATGNTIRLERIPFGAYHLKVKALTFDQLPAENEWIVPVIAKKPWYLSTWANILFVLLVFGGGAGIVSLRYAAIRRTKKQLEEEVRQRTAELVTNRNQILDQNKELKLLNDYRNQIMAIMGHDLRGPILGLSNLGQKMKYVLNRGELERVIMICNESERQIDHLRILIDNLLVWSLMQSKGDLKIHSSNTNLWEVARDQLNLLQGVAENKEQTFTLDYDPEIYFESETFALGVLIRNIIANSIRYSPNSSCIKVKVFAPAGVPTVVIEDEGPGMPLDLLAVLNAELPLNEPFKKNGQKGLGLGLWICSSLRKNLNCKWYFSAPENGKGLKVRLSFER